MYFVYIIQSINFKKFYIGYTSDLKKRLNSHNFGANRFTLKFRPWKIIYIEKLKSKKLAWKREQEIKSYKGGEAFKKLIMYKNKYGGVR
jgi:putative endonuclease